MEHTGYGQGSWEGAYDAVNELLSQKLDRRCHLEKVSEALTLKLHTFCKYCNYKAFELLSNMLGSFWVVTALETL